MTLVMAVACTDGFVMAADSEETVGDVKRYAHKLIGIEDPFQLVIASFGNSSGAFSCADLIRTKLEKSLPIVKAEEAIRTGLMKHYETYPATQGSEFGLLIGIRDEAGNSKLWRAENAQLVPITDFWCDGSGHVIATPICRSLFPYRMCVAVTHHLVTQVMRQGRRAAYVGGDIHTWSVRNSLESQGYFPVSSKNPLYLWGAEELLFAAIRDSLHGHTMRRDSALQALTTHIQDLSLFVSAPHQSQGVSLRTIDATEDSPHLMR